MSAPEDVVAEVGSALGVRDSITARRALTPEQRANLRARIAQRLGQAPVALVLFDLDRFKDLDDAHGHAPGDAVLKEVALGQS